MDGVLEGAAVLCVCKLVCSLLFLPSLAESHSPVSFCSCCLLFFTDFLVTVFLTLLSIFGPWVTDETSLGDVIALRVLLFLGHTYGVVLLLTAPLIAVETLTRVLWPLLTAAHWTKGQAKDDGLHCYVWEEPLEKEKEEEDTDDKKQFSHIVSYLCCLSVWVLVALNVSWRWRLEEVLTSSCLRTTNSLIRCLPNLFSPMPNFVHPCWGIAFLSLLMLLLSTSASLDGRQLVLGCMGREKHRDKSGIRSSSDNYWQDFVLVPSERESSCMSEPKAERCVDPEKTESSCTIQRAYSTKMSTSHHRDFVLIPPDVISAGKGGQEYGRTKRDICLTFIADNHVDSEHRSQFCQGQWGFPCLGVNVMIGFVGVLSIFVLPLNLSVNILLIRTIETLLELCVRSLVNTNDPPTLTLHNETLL